MITLSSRFGSDGNLSCTATYINRIKLISFANREVNIKASRIDYIEGGANIFNIDAHVGHLYLTTFTTANVALCDEFQHSLIMEDLKLVSPT